MPTKGKELSNGSGQMRDSVSSKVSEELVKFWIERYNKSPKI